LWLGLAKAELVRSAGAARCLDFDQVKKVPGNQKLDARYSGLSTELHTLNVGKQWRRHLAVIAS
jgi:hypothetical protein